MIEIQRVARRTTFSKAFRIAQGIERHVQGGELENAEWFGTPRKGNEKSPQRSESNGFPSKLPLRIQAIAAHIEEIKGAKKEKKCLRQLEKER